MSSDDFFYYEEEIIVFSNFLSRGGSHRSHIWEEDYEEEESGYKKARVYEERRRDEIVYYIELPGVKSPDSIDISLEENIITVRAKLGKVVIYPSLRKNVKVSEYIAKIKLPFEPEPEDVFSEFDTNRNILIIHVKRWRKRKFHKLNIDRIY